MAYRFTGKRYDCGSKLGYLQRRSNTRSVTRSSGAVFASTCWGSMVTAGAAVGASRGATGNGAPSQAMRRARADAVARPKRPVSRKGQGALRKSP